MKLRCKPGDLAIIVSAVIPENVGRIVRVVKLAARGEFQLPNGHFVEVSSDQCWHVTSDGFPLAIMRYRSGTKYPGNDAIIRDDKLRPINGVPVNEDVPESVTA